VLVFVVSSMLAMGLSLTIGQIVEPCGTLRLVGKALLANFVLVPLLGYAIPSSSLSEAQSIGLILLATAAGLRSSRNWWRTRRGTSPSALG